MRKAMRFLNDVSPATSHETNNDPVSRRNMDDRNMYINQREIPSKSISNSVRYSIIHKAKFQK